MANISKLKRDKMLAFLEELKRTHNDDESIRAFNEIENSLCEKKYGLVFEEHTEEVDERLQNEIPVLCEDKERRICKDETLPWNFIIEGDNLQALYLLEKTHKGKIDCIYIDPPYNTGAKDWKYNNDYVDSKDNYRHSKWLSMMKARLIIAKRLLNPDNSVLICTIDEKEYLHLGCLLEELFPNAKIQMVTDVINQKGVARDKEFSRVDEYIYFVKIGEASPALSINNMLHNNYTDKKGTIWIPLQRSGSESMRTDRPNMCFPIFIDEKNKKIVDVGYAPDLSVSISDIKYDNNLTAVWPQTIGKEGRWQLGRETVLKGLIEGTIKLGGQTRNGSWSILYLNEGAKKEIQEGSLIIKGKDENGALIVERTANKLTPAKTVWNQVSHDASVNGSSFLLKLFNDKLFAFPKSIYSTHDALMFFVKDKKNAIILDFFAGSGTTQHAVNLLNAEDGGKRQCISVTNNEVSADEAKTLTEKGYQKGDSEWEALGIAKHVTWPRTVCSINGCDINDIPLQGDYGVEDEAYVIDEEILVVSKNTGKPIKRNLYKKIKVQVMPELAKIKKSDGFRCNVKYFKCDWIPRRPEDYLLSNALCLHIKEMIELQTGREVDGVKQVLILNKDDYNKTVLNPDIYEKIETVWLNQNMVLSSEELEPLKAKGFKYIPREYFGHELREAAE